MLVNNCRCCENKNLKSVISLGMSPLANNLLNDETQADELFPLEMMYCPECNYCQLSCTVPPEKLFDTYLYTSSTTKSFREHFEKAAESYVKKFNLTSDSCVLDIGCNDGIALLPLKNLNVNVIGVDPAANIVKLTREKGIETIHGYFDENTVNEVLNKHGKIDLITASNVFAHSADIKQITNSVFKLLKEDGCFIIEVQYLYDTINDLTFDNIYHEHVSYWSVSSIVNFFTKLGYSVVDVEHIDTHGGSIRVYVKNKNKEVSSNVSTFLQKEKEFGLTEFEVYKNFSNKIQQVKTNVKKNFDAFKNIGLKIAGYGSPAKATTSLNYYQVDNKYIDYIIEDNKLKHGKLLPGVRIPICSKEKLSTNPPDIIVIMAWNFAEEIKKNNMDLVARGIKMVSIKDMQSEYNII
jgi:SAM-dependent methyltransferase